MKKKYDTKHKLQRVRFKEPIIAVLGGKRFTDYLPTITSNIAPVIKSSVKTNTQGFIRNRIVKKTVRQTEMLGRSI